MKKIFFLLIITLLSSANSSMQTLYLKSSCHSCHGLYAEGIDMSPKLQSMKKEVMVQKLNVYKKEKYALLLGLL